MPNHIQGSPTGAGRKIAIVVARFNSFVTERLLQGAVGELTALGVAADDITVVHVPGSFEIPAVARRLASGPHDAVICLGCVIRGETPHFEHVSAAAAQGVAAVAREAPVPVTFGVLTTETLDQAINRAGGKAGNKGQDAARAALELIDTYTRLG